MRIGFPPFFPSIHTCLRSGYYEDKLQVPDKITLYVNMPLLKIKNSNSKTPLGQCLCSHQKTLSSLLMICSQQMVLGLQATVSYTCIHFIQECSPTQGSNPLLQLYPQPTAGQTSSIVTDNIFDYKQKVFKRTQRNTLILFFQHGGNVGVNQQCPELYMNKMKGCVR